MASTSKSPRKKEQVFIPDIGKTPPEAVELEKAVLGALMLERGAFMQINDILRPESFYLKAHEYIFTAIRDLANDTQAKVDMLTVTEQLRRNGTLEAAGGPLYVAELTNNVTSALNVGFHAKIIAQKFLARELIRFTGTVQAKAYDETLDIAELMQEAEGSLFEIAQSNIKKDAIQINPIIHDAFHAIEIAHNRKEGLSGLSSGFHALDKITSGWQNSDLIIIAARPSMGKTAFVLSMAKNMAVNFKIPVALFSLEMSNIQLVKRLISNVCEIAGDKIKSGRLETYEWQQLDHKIRELDDAPIYVDDTASLSVFELRTKARRLVREHGIKCIIIDYLQLMNASGMSFDNRVQEVGKISSSLKGLAKELNIPIIALSQLNRGVEAREGKRPQLSDLRESGSIEQDADIVCFIHRPEYYKITEDEKGNDLRGKAEIIVAKHRNGATDDIQLAFKHEYVRFENLGEHSYSGDLPSQINGGSGYADVNDPLGGSDMDAISRFQNEKMPF